MASCLQAQSQDLCHDDTHVVKASINAFILPLSLASTFLSDISSVRNSSHVFYSVCCPSTSIIGSNKMLSFAFFFFSFTFVLASVEFNSWHYHSCKRNARDLDPILI